MTMNSKSIDRHIHEDCQRVAVGPGPLEPRDEVQL